MGKLTWFYNKNGHVEIWKGKVDFNTVREIECDLYLQIDTEVESFFDSIDENLKHINIGDWDYANDIYLLDVVM